MPTAKGGYFTTTGERVPSVTTILSRFNESGALIAWAASQAAKYVAENVSENPSRQDVLKLCDAAKYNYRDVRDQAADAGTMAHDAVERWIKGQPITFEGSEEVCKRARKSFDAFLEWADQTQLKVIHTEMPLVSDKYRFGGTLDAMTINNKLSLTDWKSSNALYPEYLCQIAAYGVLWEEKFPKEPIEGGYHLLRFDKTFSDFHHHFWAELETAKNSFLLMRQLYENDRELKARVK
jgi:hypothetical protein